MADQAELRAAGVPDKEKVERAVGIVLIDDGQTLQATIKGARGAIKITYRPALPSAVYDYRIAISQAKTGQEQLEAKAVILAKHVESWEGVTKKTAAGYVPIRWTSDCILKDPAVQRGLGAEYVDEMVSIVGGFSPEQWEEAAKNS